MGNEDEEGQPQQAHVSASSISRPATPSAVSSRPQTPNRNASSSTPVPMEQEDDDDDGDEEDDMEAGDLGQIARVVEDSLPEFPTSSAGASLIAGSPEAVELSNSTVALLLAAQKEEWSRLLDEVAKSRAVAKHREFQARTVKELLENQRREVQNAQVALFASQSKMKAIELELSEALDELAQFKDRVASMRLSSDAVQQLSEDLRSAKEMQEQLGEKVSGLMQLKQEEDKKKQRLEQQLQDYRQSLTRFTTTSRTVVSRLKDLRSYVDGLKKGQSDLKTENAGIHKKLALLEESVAAKESLLGQLRERLDQTSDLLQREKTSCRRFEEERTLLSIELASARNRNVDLSFQLSQKNGELSETIMNTQNEKAQLLSTLQRSQNEVTDKASRIARLEDEVSKANKDLLNKDSEMSTLKGRIAELEAKNQEVVRKNQELTILSEIMQTSRDDNRPRSSGGRPSSTSQHNQAAAPTTSGYWDSSSSQPTAAAATQQQSNGGPPAPQHQQQVSQGTTHYRPSSASSSSCHHKRIRVEDDDNDDEDLLRDPFSYNPTDSTSAAKAPASTAQPPPAKKTAASTKLTGTTPSSSQQGGSRKRGSGSEKKWASNKEKEKEDDNRCPICKENSLGLMYLCPLCLKEYHAACVKNQAGGKSVSARGFICGDCS